MTGKVCIVTGATAGIGYETALALAKKGATVMLVGRNTDKGQMAMARIHTATRNEELFFVNADMSDQSSIRDAALAIREQFPVIDVLVNNAGTWVSQYTPTVDGIETVFAVNHLAYFLFTHLLYPSLRNAPDTRIVNVSSDSHFQTDLHFEDLNLSKNYSGLRSYAQSKLANVHFTYEFERRKPDAHVAINAVQPGLVYTDIGLKHTTWLHALGWKLRRSIWRGMTPAEGAQTSIFLASSDAAKGQSGLYWDRCKPKPSSPASYNEENAARLWGISEELCGMKEGFFAG
ncbi:MAG: SDR family oxidoreductase [Saprospiraceae bacterium]|nr:SDR family oxidoreductase [Saprospiraceae bacterium]